MLRSLSFILLFALAAHAAPPKLVKEIPDSGGPAVLLKDGKTVLCRYRKDDVLGLFDATSGKLIRAFNQPKEGRPGRVHILAVDPKGKLVATAGMVKGWVEVWDIATGDRVVRFELPKRSYGVMSLAFGPKGKQLLVGALNEVIFCDPKSGERKRAYKAHPHPQAKDKSSFVNAIAVHKKGLVATGEDDHSVRVWRLKGFREVVKLAPLSRRGTVAAFHPKDPSTILAGDMGGQLQLYTGGQQKPIRGAHRTGLVGIAFAKKGKLALTYDEDCTLKGWSFPACKQVFELKAYRNDVASNLSVHKNGRVVTGGLTTGVKVWKLR